VAGLWAASALLAGGARTQYFGAGSTPVGDYLRGVGIAAAGMGIYNERTAVADRINAQTFILLNEYMWNVAKNENREAAEHRAEIRARNAENYKKLQERIHDHPEPLEVQNGDALNAALRDLLAPTISDSVSRYAKVPLDADVIRRIPFQLGEKGDKFSMARLLLKGNQNKKWSVAFQDPRFAGLRQAYERAVDDALELAIDGKMREEAIENVEKAVQDIEDRLKQTPYLLDPKNQRLYSEAKAQVDLLRLSARLFKTLKIQQVLGEIDSYAGTTVDELRLFMRRHNLTFAPADTPDERTLYPQVYTALVEHRRKSTGSE
jgi:hypothetical protein